MTYACKNCGHPFTTEHARDVHQASCGVNHSLKKCIMCNGTGYRIGGIKCTTCGGAGKVP